MDLVVISNCPTEVTPADADTDDLFKRQFFDQQLVKSSQVIPEKD